MSPEGRIVTFYSYKGGTGRSMALANVAWILAAAGKRVLAVDWDLEAPGLHRYFHPFLADPEAASTPGVIDFVTEYAMAADAAPRRHRPGDWYLPYAGSHALRRLARRHARFPTGATLDFVSSGPTRAELRGTRELVRLAELLGPARRSSAVDRDAQSACVRTTTTC